MKKLLLLSLLIIGCNNAEKSQEKLDANPVLHSDLSSTGLEYFNRGEAKFDEKDYKGAIEDFTKVIEIEPNYKRSYLYRGISKRNLEDYKGAIEDFTKAIEKDPAYESAYLFRGRAKYDLIQQGNSILIEDYLDVGRDVYKAIQINPPLVTSPEIENFYSVLYFDIGNLHADLKDFKSACEYWEKATHFGNEYSVVLARIHCN